ncbi:DNA (cytosine-5)-methyltransferase cmt3 [Phtheirospermum japonicum]|uniref:DNA (cytosine-5-)-methyltransferase n=1 Tax=Phtheirospermum japonicum TaxID=374723 RepID=A0A830C353_9LAMI|nr:DNA (cytosine-5)-methyltransferase cmt3 [Phtheirospermum japonicum]
MGRGKKRAAPSKPSSSSPKKPKPAKGDDLSFIGPPVPPEEAKSRWPHRYKSKSMTEKISSTLSDGSTQENDLFQAKCHYTKATVDGVVFSLFDNAYIQACEGKPNYIAKIVEMFETVNNKAYICTQWFYRAKDTMDLAEREKAKGSCELYVDMMYSFPHAFTNFYTDNKDSSLSDGLIRTNFSDVAKPQQDFQRSKSTLLDLYSGCGAMSSGLSIGASLGGVNISTKWAVDFNICACESLKSNHPNTEVRNEDAEDYFLLLKEWEKLCKEFNLVGSKEGEIETNDMQSDETEIDDGPTVSSGEYEVEKLLAICYGDPNKLKKRGLHFKVRWKGYGKNDDTWEPVDGLGNCKEKIREFVSRAHRAKEIPLPGDVDFICGGPPCQGISGFNRFREVSDPLKDKKNRQLVVFMDIVAFLKPRFVLMENVTDILKFAKGHLACYAVGRLVSMNYQARLGIMAAGAYGVPQCRMRFFLWGAGPMERLPQFPLPTHKVLKKGVVINEFKEIIVGHENEHSELREPVLLGEAISDLPKVTNDATMDEMPYGTSSSNEFQKNIRLRRRDIFPDSQTKDSHKAVLYDHRPFKLNADDYERVCHIPKVKGANFRDLPGVIVDSDNVVHLDPSMERPLLKSGKPLVPDYALSFESGKSCKPFGRLGMDDIVATVVTRPEPHNQVILHPNQDRVLSVRENARLQGFPDCYKLYGIMRERYMQVGNAVSFSVSIPLGFCLARSMHGANNARPLSVPFKFPECLGKLKSRRQEESEESES